MLMEAENIHSQVQENSYTGVSNKIFLLEISANTTTIDHFLYPPQLCMFQ